MTKFLRTHKLELTFAAVLGVLYFLFRLPYLTSLPIFTDEAIYIRWAQISLNDASWRFISLTDGKQPMFVWGAMAMMKLFADPLLAGRMTSVACGFLAMIGLWFLTYELFKNRWIAFLTALLFVFYPFAQVYDRMALYDSMVGMFAIWALYFSVLLVRWLRLDIAYTLGGIIGLGMLTKTSAFFNLGLLPATLLLFDIKKPQLLRRLIIWGVLTIIVAGIAFGLYSVLRLSPFFGVIDEKNSLFVYPVNEWIQHPFTFFIGNLRGLTIWLYQYLKLPYVLLILVSLVFLKRFWREKIMLTLYFLAPFIFLALFGKVIFPRFIYFMSLYLLPLAGWGLYEVITVFDKTLLKKQASRLKHNVLAIGIVSVFLFYPGFVSLQFIADPVSVPIANADSSQYINGWTAGWGVKESIAFFDKEAADKKIFIGTEGTFGLLPYALEMYLLQNKNITIKAFWPVGDTLPEEALAAAETMPAYFIFYQPEHTVIPPSYPVKLLKEYKAGNSEFSYRIYQITPN
jgi:4-amino-4-deoxy-L-arabinose transferase-like glycosyltransferase